MSEHLRDARLRKEKNNSHFGKRYGPEDLAFAMLEKVFGAERTDRQLREANV